MIKQKYGKIVIISSGSAVTGTGGGAHYASSKAGQIGLVRALANEFSQYNINVNAVAPRTIKTELLTELYPTEEGRNKLIEKIPIGRLGEAEDVANVAIFLSSDESSFITGQYILADGGRTFS
jgi:3-oxoacyl-[acyl-carrier protein] reductase